MSTLSRVVKNTIVLYIAKGLSFLITFFYVMYSARYLGPTNYGIISLALAYAGVFSILADFGIQKLTIREIAREKETIQSYITNIALMKIILALITYALLATIVYMMSYPVETMQVVWILGVTVVFSSFTQFLNAIFQSFERMELQAAGQVLNAIVMAIGVFCAVHFSWSVLLFAALYASTSFLIMVYSCITTFWVLHHKIIRPIADVKSIDWALWKHIMRNAWPIGIVSVIGIVYFKIDVLMLQAFKGATEVGLYSAAHQLMELTYIIPEIIITALFPLMSRYYVNSALSLNKIYKTLFKYFLVISSLIALLVTLLGDQIIGTIYGVKFVNSTGLLKILIWSTIPIYISTVMASMYIIANKQRPYLILQISLLFVNVLLNLVLIPAYSNVGASVAKIICASVELIINFVIFTRFGYKIQWKTEFVPILVCFVVVLLSTTILLQQNINTYIISGIAIVVYSALILKLCFTQDDVSLIKRILLILLPTSKKQ